MVTHAFSGQVGPVPKHKLVGLSDRMFCGPQPQASIDRLLAANYWQPYLQPLAGIQSLSWKRTCSIK